MKLKSDSRLSDAGRQAPWAAPRVVALLAAALTLALGLSLFSMRAYAAFVPIPTAQGPHLRLHSDPLTAQFLGLSPGSVERWQIAAAVVEPSAALTVQFARSGSLVTHPADGLQLQVQRCDAVWTSITTTPACSDSGHNLFGPAAASSLPVGPAADLAGITGAKGKYLLVTLSLPDTPQARADKSLQGLSATIGFGLTASAATLADTGGVTPAAVHGQALAFTGADALPLALLAIAAIALGIIVTGARKIRQSNDLESLS